MSEIFTLILLVAITLAFGWAGTKLGFATVVGQLIAGVIIGPAILGLVHESHAIELLAEAGVLLLMVNAGLETDSGTLLKNFKAANLVAILGVALPLLLFPAFALVLGYEFKIAIFWGVVFAATSISITIAVLAESNKLGGQVGAVILGAAVLDDILALALVTLYAALVGGAGLSPTTLLPLIAFAVGLLLRRFFNTAKLLHWSEIIGSWTLFPLFFGSIGLSVKFDNFGETWWLMIIMTILAVITKFYGAGWGARLAGMTKDESNAIGSGMVSRGEMALIIAQIGAGTGVLTGGVFGELVIVIIASTIVAPLLMRPLFKKI